MLAKNFLISNVGLIWWQFGIGNNSISTSRDSRSFARWSAIFWSARELGQSESVKRKIRLEKDCFSTILNSWWQIQSASKRGDLGAEPLRLEPVSAYLDWDNELPASAELLIWVRSWTTASAPVSSKCPWSLEKVVILVSNCFIKLASGISREYMTWIFLKLSEFSFLTPCSSGLALSPQPYKTMPTLSFSLVMILVFTKLRAALRTCSMFDSWSAPLCGFYTCIDLWQSMRKMTESFYVFISSISCVFMPNMNRSLLMPAPSPLPPWSSNSPKPPTPKRSPKSIIVF
mgnify:CR=1 FL=1